jgi:hypothetical protein
MAVSETEAAALDAGFAAAGEGELDRRRVILARIAVILAIVGVWQLVVAIGLVDAFWISTLC